MVHDVVKLILSALVFIVVEIAVGPYLDVSGRRPDLLIILVFTLAVYKGPREALWVGFLGGLVQDAVSLHFLGVNAFAKSTLGFWLGWHLDRQTLPYDTWVFPLLVLVGAWLQFTWAGVFLLMGADISFLGYVFSIALPSAFYTAFLSFIWILIPGLSRLVGARAPGRGKLKGF